MITKITLKNIARWKGEHTIEFDKGISILDGNKGAGKSSLLLDTLKIVFTNSGRTSYFKDVITKEEDEAEIIMFYETPKKVKYKLYWYHKLKGEKESIDKRTGKSKIVQTTAKTIWDVYLYNEETKEYEKSYITPEKVLGLPYNIASKTFIVEQSDLDAFSKAGPTEKYDVIADSFNISTLFQIGDTSSSKVKSLVTEKEVYMKNLDNIDTSEFEHLPSKKKELEDLEKTLEKNKKSLLEKENEYKSLHNEELEISKYLEVNLFVIQDQDKISKLTTLYNSEILPLEKQIKELEEKIKEQDVSKMESLESKLEELEGQKLYFQEKNEKEKNNLIESSKLSERSYVQELTFLQQEFNKTKLDFSPLTEEKKIELDLYLVDGSTKEQEDKELFEKYSNELNAILKESIEVNSEVSRLKTIISKLVNLQQVNKGSCPTCERTLSNDEIFDIIKKYEEEVSVLQEKINKLEKEKKSINDSSINLQTNLQLLDLYRTYKENQKYKKLGQTKKNEYLKVVAFNRQKLETLIKTQEDEFQDISQKIMKVYRDLENLKKNSKYVEYQNQLNILLSKTFKLQDGSRLYKREEVLPTINYLEEQVRVKQLQLSSYKISKGIGEELTLESYKTEIINKKTKLEEEKNKIYNTKENLEKEYYELKSYVDKLIEYKSQYDQVQEKLEDLNKKITRLERISQIFGKKGHPKTIIEEIILPQLERETNQILEDTTEGHYNVEFTLSSKTADGRESKKTIFDIYVNIEGVKQNYDSMSGGEKVLVNYAIRLGITECLNSLVGERVTDILVLDEAFLAIESQLAAENIFKSIQETSKSFKQVFIITHEELLKERLGTISNVHTIVKEGKYSKLLS